MSSNNKNEFVSKDKLRAEFLRKLSGIYNEESPEYREFVDIVSDSNKKFIEDNPYLKCDPLDRVVEERHGAIRVGKAEEMRMVTRIFECFGMEPVNFYDLTSVKKAMPIIATAFRPKTEDEINKSAFRVFTSMLVLDDDRFFDEKQKNIAKEQLAKRNLFSKKLLNTLNIAEKNGGLNKKESEILLEETINIFRFDSKQVIDFNLYKNFIIDGNDVAADIVCFNTIHINHLTPRVYDIFDTHQVLKDRGIPTIDQVQGPPRRDNEEALPLLNQTSRKAPGDFIYASIDKDLLNHKNQSHIIDQLEKEGKIKFVEPKKNETIKDYLKHIEETLDTEKTKVVAIKHKARFGEIECRGVALTTKGRKIYDKMVSDGTYVKLYPKTHIELAEKKYAYYKYELANDSNYLTEEKSHEELINLVKEGKIIISPIIYEDFLPKSAAGIFESNLSENLKERENLRNTEESKKQQMLEKAINKRIISSDELYSKSEDLSKKKLFLKKSE